MDRKRRPALALPTIAVAAWPAHAWAHGTATRSTVAAIVVAAAMLAVLVLYVAGVHALWRSAGKRLRFQDNHLTVLDGPFSESKELIGGFSIMELPSLDEAIEVARRYAAILGGTLEVDLRPIDTDAAGG